MTTGTVTAANGKPVNMRKSPNASSDLVDRVPVGAEVTVRSHDEEWAQISYKGRVGYMMAKYLTISGAVPEAVSGDLEARLAALEARVKTLEEGAAVG